MRCYGGPLASRLASCTTCRRCPDPLLARASRAPPARSSPQHCPHRRLGARHLGLPLLRRLRVQRAGAGRVRQRRARRAHRVRGTLLLVGRAPAEWAGGCGGGTSAGAGGRQGAASVAATCPSPLPLARPPQQMLLWSRDVTLFTDGEELHATDLVGGRAGRTSRRWQGGQLPCCGWAGGGPAVRGRRRAARPLPPGTWPRPALPTPARAPWTGPQEREQLARQGVRVIETPIARSAAAGCGAVLAAALLASQAGREHRPRHLCMPDGPAAAQLARGLPDHPPPCRLPLSPERRAVGDGSGHLAGLVLQDGCFVPLKWGERGRGGRRGGALQQSWGAAHCAVHSLPASAATAAATAAGAARLHLRPAARCRLSLPITPPKPPQGAVLQHRPRAELAPAAAHGPGGGRCAADGGCMLGCPRRTAVPAPSAGLHAPTLA